MRKPLINYFAGMMEMIAMKHFVLEGDFISSRDP